jgi:hypothetical protein
VAPVAVSLASVHPEGGDPNDFMARIEPAGGEDPIHELELVERFFGALAASPGEAALRALRDKAQADLPDLLARWDASRTVKGSTAKLLVRLPFPIAGDAGSESMWVEVTGHDSKTITGTLVDDPLGATQVHKGDAVTRPLTEVEATQAGGGLRSP